MRETNQTTAYTKTEIGRAFHGQAYNTCVDEPFATKAIPPDITTAFATKANNSDATTAITAQVLSSDRRTALVLHAPRPIPSVR